MELWDRAHDEQTRTGRDAQRCERFSSYAWRLVRGWSTRSGKARCQPHRGACRAAVEDGAKPPADLSVQVTTIIVLIPFAATVTRAAAE